MKILHTADWHIGKQLYRHSLELDFNLFFEWLLGIIQQQQIDLLLISGDIFDSSNPSLKDRDQYYKYLTQLSQSGVSTIITGGNHDSIKQINLAKQLLKSQNIYVIGGATENIEEELIPLTINNEKIIIAAVPFLRDKDLRTFGDLGKFKNRIEAINYGIKKHYKDLATICKRKYPNLLCIAMGHLYARGVSSSDSEREIHIGNAAAVHADIFDPIFQYIALGHIHRPQIVDKNQSIRYSGSPISLSFSERKDKKSVVYLYTEHNRITDQKIIEVPKSRELIKVSDTFVNLKNKIETYKNTTKLPSYFEIEIIEKEYDATLAIRISDWLKIQSDRTDLKIINYKYRFENTLKKLDQLFEEGIKIDQLTPLEVFKKRIDLEALESTQKDDLQELFEQLLDKVQNQE